MPPILIENRDEILSVLRNLQTLAESARRTAEALRAREPDVAWEAIAGFRNVLVHDSLGSGPANVE